jgi:hypothetical protein
MKLKKIGIALLSCAILIGVIDFFSFSSREESNNVFPPQFEETVSYRIKLFEYDHDINFCGEKVPLHSQDIYERFDYEILKNAYWHSEMLLYFKRARKYFPVIEPILKANNIPEDFKYLAIIESGLTNVTSPAGAKGFWQIMEATAIEKGLEVNDQIDERNHLEKATLAACKYLKEAHRRFDSWTLVAASYNMGMNGLERRLKQQEVNSYYDLHLNSETARYVFRILAVKDIFENPKKYGFNIFESGLYEPIKFKQVKVNSTITDLSVFAKEQGINYKILKIVNPWLKNKELIISGGKEYYIDIPEDNFFTFSNDTAQTDSVVASSNKEVMQQDSIHE